MAGKKAQKTMNFIFFTALLKDPATYAPVMLAVIFSICCHEYAHAKTAQLLGDDTAANAGHLTLNPFKQMGWISLAMLLVFGFAWGAVPVNPENLRSKYRDAIVSLAGPLTNAALWLISGILALAAHLCRWPAAVNLFAYAGLMNLVMFVLNLMPLPGLDGAAVWGTFLPLGKIGRSEFGKGAAVIIIAIIFFSLDKIYDAAFFCNSLYLKTLAGMVK